MREDSMKLFRDITSQSYWSANYEANKLKYAKELEELKKETSNSFIYCPHCGKKL